VSVALDIQHGIISEKRLLNIKLCFDFLHYFQLKHFSFLQEMSKILSYMFVDFHLKYLLVLSDFNKI